VSPYASRVDVFVGGFSPWPAHLALLGVGFALSVIDQRTHRLPDVIVLPAWGASAAYFTLIASSGSTWEAWERSFGVMAVTVMLLWLMAELPGYPLGFGDVKLGGVIATHLGWHSAPLAFVGIGSAFFFAGVWSAVLWIFRKHDPSRHIPLGPWLIGGFAWALVVHRMVNEGAEAI